MPECAAVGCSNSTKKGFLMKKFLKDAKRRREWALKIKRDGWKPTDFVCLCEVSLYLVIIQLFEYYLFFLIHNHYFTYIFPYYN